MRVDQATANRLFMRLALAARAAEFPGPVADPVSLRVHVWLDELASDGMCEMKRRDAGLRKRVIPGRRSIWPHVRARTTKSRVIRPVRGKKAASIEREPKLADFPDAVFLDEIDVVNAELEAFATRCREPATGAEVVEPSLRRGAIRSERHDRLGDVVLHQVAEHHAVTIAAVVLADEVFPKPSATLLAVKHTVPADFARGNIVGEQGEYFVVQRMIHVVAVHVHELHDRVNILAGGDTPLQLGDLVAQRGEIAAAVVARMWRYLTPGQQEAEND